MVMGLTTALWVSTQVRLCDRAFIPAAVVRRGDPDVGTVLVKVTPVAGAPPVLPKLTVTATGSPATTCVGATSFNPPKAGDAFSPTLMVDTPRGPARSAADAA